MVSRSDRDAVSIDRAQAHANVGGNDWPGFTPLSNEEDRRHCDLSYAARRSCPSCCPLCVIYSAVITRWSLVGSEAQV
jgi:hypothetical protein